MSVTYTEPGICNALDTMFQGGMRKLNTGQANAAALQAAINYALQHGGGIVVIPSNDGTPSTQNYYPIQPPSGSSVAVTIPASGYSAAPLLICGTGPGTVLQMQASGDLFDINANDNVFFQDLTVEYAQNLGPFTGAAFNFNGGQNYGLLRVLIQDCQYPVKFFGTTQAYMRQCWIHYVNYPTSQELRAIQIDGTETMIADCLLANNANFASNQYGVVIGGSTSASGTRVCSTQVESFYNGMVLQSVTGQKTTTSLFEGVRVATVPGGTCLSIGPTVYNARFVGCHFQNPDGNMNSAQCIVLDPGAAGNAAIDSVTFESCTSKTSQDYGLQIKGGQNLQVLGGTYSGNVTAGIGITGAATEIQLVGVNCLGISWVNGGKNKSNPQQYGIYIVAGQDIEITGANCSGTGQSGTPGTGIYINGSGVSGVKISGAVCSGPAFGNLTMQQYGVYVQGASGIAIAACSLTGNTAYGLYLVSVSDVTVNGCDLFGNGSTSGGGIYLDGGPTQSAKVFIADCDVSGYTSPRVPITFANELSEVEVTDCAGYNDTGMPVSTTPPGNGQPFHAYDPPYSYHGSVVFYCAEGSNVSVSIDGRSTGLASGRFVLGPGDVAAISYSTAPSFLMIGE